MAESVPMPFWSIALNPLSEPSRRCLLSVAAYRHSSSSGPTVIKDVLLTSASDDTHCHRQSIHRVFLSVRALAPFTTHGNAILLCLCGRAPFAILF